MKLLEVKQVNAEALMRKILIAMTKIFPKIKKSHTNFDYEAAHDGVIFYVQKHGYVHEEVIAKIMGETKGAGHRVDDLWKQTADALRDVAEENGWLLNEGRVALSASSANTAYQYFTFKPPWGSV